MPVQKPQNQQMNFMDLLKMGLQMQRMSGEEEARQALIQQREEQTNKLGEELRLKQEADKRRGAAAAGARTYTLSGNLTGEKGPTINNTAIADIVGGMEKPDQMGSFIMEAMKLNDARQKSVNEEKGRKGIRSLAQQYGIEGAEQFGNIDQTQGAGIFKQLQEQKYKQENPLYQSVTSGTDILKFNPVTGEHTKNLTSTPIPTERQRNTAEWSKVTGSVEELMAQGQDIPNNLYREALSFAPDDSQRQILELQMLGHREKIGTISPTEQNVLNSRRGELAKKGMGIERITIADNTGRENAYLIDTVKLSQGVPRDKAIVAKFEGQRVDVVDDVLARKFADSSIEKLELIQEIHDLVMEADPSNFGLQGQAKGAMASIYNYVLSPKNAEKVPEMIRDGTKRNVFSAELYQNFMVGFRTPVTGSQAGMVELNALLRRYINDKDYGKFLGLATKMTQIYGKKAKLEYNMAKSRKYPDFETFQQMINDVGAKTERYNRIKSAADELKLGQ